MCLCLTYGLARADAASADLARKHLYAGTLVAGEVALTAKVNADRGDREARLGFVRAVKRLGQSLYRYGATHPKTLSIPSRCQKIQRPRRSATRRFGTS